MLNYLCRLTQYLGIHSTGLAFLKPCLKTFLFLIQAVRWCGLRSFMDNNLLFEDGMQHGEDINFG